MRCLRTESFGLRSKRRGRAGPEPAITDGLFGQLVDHYARSPVMPVGCFSGIGGLVCGISALLGPGMRPLAMGPGFCLVPPMPRIIGRTARGSGGDGIEDATVRHLHFFIFGATSFLDDATPGGVGRCLCTRPIPQGPPFFVGGGGSRRRPRLPPSCRYVPTPHLT